VAAREWTFGRWLAVATALGAVVRLAWVAHTWNDPIGFEDAYFYHHQANLLADGKGFVSPFPYLSAGRPQPGAEHPPLFSLYLMVFSLAGATSVGWHQVATVIVGIGTVALIGLAGRAAGGERVGVVAAFVAAVYPHLWYQDGIVWAEASAQATIALFVLAAYRYVRRPTARALVVVALAAVVASMARTELILLLPLGVGALIVMTEHVTWARRARWTAAAIGIGLVALAPWVALNLGRFDRTTTLSSNLGLTLASANCDSTWYGNRIGYWDFTCASSAGQKASYAGGDPSVVDAEARREALEYIDANRSRLPAVIVARLGRITGLYAPRQQVLFDQLEGRPPAVASAGMATWWLVATLAVVGIVGLRRAGIPTVPATLPVVVMLVGVVTAFASTRYRASAEPAVVVLAAAGWVVVFDSAMARLRARPARPAPSVTARGATPADRPAPAARPR